MNRLRKIICIIMSVFAFVGTMQLPVYAQGKMSFNSVSSPKEARISLSWNPYSGASYYEVRLARASRINNGAKGEKNVLPADVTSVTWKTAFSNEDYKVRIRALDKNKNAISDWSDWASVFIIAEAPRGSKMLLSNVYSPDKSKVTIAWNSVSGTAKYEIRLARASKINNGSSGEKKLVSGDKTSVTYTTKYDNIDYKIRIRALDSNNDAITEWSDWQQVYIK